MTIETSHDSKLSILEHTDIQQFFSGHAFYLLYIDSNNTEYTNSSFHPDVWNHLISNVPELLTMIGFCYYTGRSGVKQNLTYALECFKIAADQLFPPAQYFLGLCYDRMNRLGLAVMHYQDAAGRHFAPAIYALAQCYKNGKGMNENNEKAFALYKMAALQKYAPALYQLGTCYQYGTLGAPKNLIEARKMFAAAAGQGYDMKTIEISYKRLNEQEKMGDTQSKKKGWFWGGKTTQTRRLQRTHKAISRQRHQTRSKKKL